MIPVEVCEAKWLASNTIILKLTVAKGKRGSRPEVLMDIAMLVNGEIDRGDC